MLRTLLALLIACSLCAQAFASSRWGCHGLCSGHGYCLEGDISCRCVEGFVGPDCSQRVCPAGTAWADYPTANGTAHAPLVECSNMGHCDRSTGTCECRSGFTGAACERMLCPIGENAMGLPQECSGQGRCLSLRHAAWEASNYQLDIDDWDADMIHGCVCDSGFEGPACQLHTCPTGDDPANPGAAEVQIIECTCLGSCDGNVTVQFGRKSTTLPSYSTPELIQHKLQRLPQIGDLDIEIHGGDVLCSLVGSATMITFLTAPGDVPLLELAAPDNLNITIVSGGANSTMIPELQSVVGTKGDFSCSRKGACKTATGTCECNSFYASSDGHGGPGNRQDCGYFMGQDADPDHDSCGTIVGVDNSTCSNRGVCVEDMCVCDEGFHGPLCEFHDCISNFAWFGHDGHLAPSVCSSMGICDYNTGGCICDTSYRLWEGEACEELSCADECSGNGPCLTMRQLGELALDEYSQISPVHYLSTWDASRIKTCHCEYPDTADSQDAASNAAYSGPYAGSVPGKKGYNCGRWNCPKGDNFLTPGENEIQSISCSATDGWFYLTFKTNRTDPIPYNSTADIIQATIENLRSVSKVAVTIEGGEHVCDPDAVTHVEFLSDTGTLPMMVPTTLGALAGNVTVVQTKPGTRERLECSQLGNCEETTGICRCVAGLISSDGDASIGDRGDCGFFNKWATAYYERWYGKNG